MNVPEGLPIRNTSHRVLSDNPPETAGVQDYTHSMLWYAMDRNSCRSTHSLSQVLGQASAFLARFAQSHGEPQYALSRLQQVIQQIQQMGCYQHTPEELAYGVQLGWQPHLPTRADDDPASLAVRDLRHVLTEEALFFALLEQMQEMCHSPQRPPLVAVFAPACLGQPPLGINLFSRTASVPDGDSGEPHDAEWDRLATAALRIHLPPREPMVFPLSPQRVHRPFPIALRSNEQRQCGLQQRMIPHLHIRALDIGGLCYITTCCFGWISSGTWAEDQSECMRGREHHSDRTGLVAVLSDKEDHRQ